MAQDLPAEIRNRMKRALRKHPTRNNPERNKPEIRKNPEHVHKARK